MSTIDQDQHLPQTTTAERRARSRGKGTGWSATPIRRASKTKQPKPVDGFKPSVEERTVKTTTSTLDLTQEQVAQILTKATDMPEGTMVTFAISQGDLTGVHLRHVVTEEK